MSINIVLSNLTAKLQFTQAFHLKDAGVLQMCCSNNLQSHSVCLLQSLLYMHKLVLQSVHPAIVNASYYLFKFETYFKQLLSLHSVYMTLTGAI